MDPASVMNSAIGQCCCHALRRATRQVSSLYDEALAPVGLRIGQFSILVLLWESGDLAVGTVADRMGLDRTTAGKNLKPLERQGYIAFKENALDRRSKDVSLTPAGRDVLRRAAPLWQEAQSAFEAAYGSAEARQLKTMLMSVPSAKAG